MRGQSSREGLEGGLWSGLTDPSSGLRRSMSRVLCDKRVCRRREPAIPATGERICDRGGWFRGTVGSSGDRATRRWSCEERKIATSKARSKSRDAMTRRDGLRAADRGADRDAGADDRTLVDSTEPGVSTAMTVA
ncbi:hypothetical protein CLOM_g5245 [Closterium sp. NIES-68]|nr:hypothetical protein CLOM_g5245 [Closterium sp. NIES-68]GJP58282.1 hypothetical protein CLOP_g22988 [Closterium sp. NIES-67]